MSEITLSLEHPNLGCGEIIARYDLSEIQEKAYQQGKADEQLRSIESAKEQAKEYRVALEKAKADGAREFLAWYSGGETMPSFGRYANYKIDDVIAEWQKGAENGKITERNNG